jgi:hypothetical protein
MDYLPCPLEVDNYALDQNKLEEKVLRDFNNYIITVGQIISLYFTSYNTSTLYHSLIEMTND